MAVVRCSNPFCRKDFSIPEAILGKAVTCPHCEREMKAVAAPTETRLPFGTGSKEETPLRFGKSVAGEPAPPVPFGQVRPGDGTPPEAIPDLPLAADNQKPTAFELAPQLPRPKPAPRKATAAERAKAELIPPVEPPANKGKGWSASAIAAVLILAAAAAGGWIFALTKKPTAEGPLPSVASNASADELREALRQTEARTREAEEQKKQADHQVQLSQEQLAAVNEKIEQLELELKGSEFYLKGSGTSEANAQMEIKKLTTELAQAKQDLATAQQDRIAADDERRKAVQGYQDAEKERVKVVESLLRIRREQYAVQFAAAVQNFDAAQPAQVRTLLNECPEDLRDWEWQHVQRRLNSPNTASQTFEIANGRPIRAPVLAPDGKQVALALGSNVLVVNVEPVTGERLPVSKRLVFNIELAKENVSALAFAGDAATLAIGLDDGTTTVYFDKTNSKQIAKVTSGVTAMVLGDAVRATFVGCKDGSVHTVPGWDQKGITTQLVKYTSAVNAMAIAPDRKFLAIGLEEKTVRVFDFENGRPLATYSGHENPITSLAVSPDGKLILSGDRGNAIHFWDARTGDVVFKAGVTLHRSGVAGLHFRSDGQRFVSAGEDGSVSIWNAYSGKLLMQLKKGANRAGAAACFNRDESDVVSVSNDLTAQVWFGTADKSGYISSTGKGIAALSPDGKWVVAQADLNGKSGLWLWEAGGTKAVHVLEGSAKVGTNIQLAFSGDGKLVICRSPTGFTTWNPLTGKQVAVLVETPSTKTPAPATVGPFAVTPDGSKLVCFLEGAKVKSRIQLGELLTAKLERGLTSNTNYAGYTKEQFAISQNGKYLAVAYSEAPRQPNQNRKHFLRVENYNDIVDGTMRNIAVEMALEAQCLHFDPKSELLLVLSRNPQNKNCRLEFYDATTGKLTRSIPMASPLRLVTYLNSDNLIAVPEPATPNSPGEVAMLDATTGKREGATLKGHRTPIVTAAVSADGKTLLTASSDGIIRIRQIAGN